MWKIEPALFAVETSLSGAAESSVKILCFAVQNKNNSFGQT